MFVAFAAFGVLCAWLFHIDQYLPIWASVAAMGAVAAYVGHEYRRDRFGPLTFLLLIVFLLPFIHVIPYLWFDFEVAAPGRMWGLAVNPYMIDRDTVELMAMMGATGAAALAVGAGLAAGKIRALVEPEKTVAPTRRSTLSMPVFLGWVGMSILLSWISAPAEMLFTAEYGESKAIEQGLNFSSAWMISYGFLLFALADSIFEIDLSIAKLKRRIVVVAMAVIVVWFQLLRGDRESLPLILAAILVYYVWGKGLLMTANVRVKIPRTTLVLLALAVFASAYFVGKLRHSLTDVSDTSELLSVAEDTGASSFDNAITGTWSAVLLTPLSVAGDYERGLTEPRYGQTYVDLVGSSMPGFVADWIGYERPIDSTKGPAWDMRYGQGGTHAVVVPFLNFRMIGVFSIVALWSLLMATLERRVLRQVTVAKLALLGILAMAAPHWLWYGEKNMITAMLIWSVLAIAHRVSSTDLRVRAPSPSRLPA